MDFNLDETQSEIAGLARRILEDKVDHNRLKEIEAGTFDPDDWTKQGIDKKLFEAEVEEWLEEKEREEIRGEFAPSTLFQYKSIKRIYFGALHGQDDHLLRKHRCWPHARAVHEVVAKASRRDRCGPQPAEL